MKFERAARSDHRAKARDEIAAKKLRSFRGGAEQWKLPTGESVESAIARLKANPEVEYAEPNIYMRGDISPNDPLYPKLYGLNNDGQTGGTPGAAIDAERAWEITTGSRNVVVAIIDSGIDYNHPDLAANVWANPNEVPANGIDDDGNGLVDDVRGWDFANSDNDPLDDNGHGTHVSGTLGAVGNNAAGVVGVNWHVSILPIKFIGAAGDGELADAVASVEYATSMGADVINCSWGGEFASQALLDAIKSAGEADILVVAAAGNGGADGSIFPHYPADYDAQNILSIAATDRDDRLAVFSNFGAKSTDLGSPGVEILSTLPGASYGLLSGTSMAAPHVSGVAALMRAVAPDISATAMKERLIGTAEPVLGLDGNTLSGGRLNAFRALAERDHEPPGEIGDLAACCATSDSILLTWTASGDDGDAGIANSYDIRLSRNPIDEMGFGNSPRAHAQVQPSPAGQVQSVELRDLDADSTYYFAVKAVDEWGNSGALGLVAIGRTLPTPIIATEPGSFEVAMLAGRTTTRALTIRNEGGGMLDWHIPASDGFLSSEPIWFAVSPRSGRLSAGEIQAVTLQVDTAGLAGGTYEHRMIVQSNDPLRPMKVLDVALAVTDAPAIDVDTAGLDFGQVEIGQAAVRRLTVGNGGTLTLRVSGIVSSDPSVSADGFSFGLPAGSNRTLLVRYAPAAVGALSSHLTIQSDAPGQEAAVVRLAGAGVPARELLSVPNSISEVLLSGGRVTRTLTIINSASSAMPVSLSADPGVTADDPERGWLGVTPASALIPPEGSTTATVTIDADSFGLSTSLGEVRIQTDTAVLRVPVSLSVLGVPRIHIPPSPEDIFDKSASSSFSDLERSIFTISTPLPPAGDGTVELTVTGFLSSPEQQVTLSADGILLTTLEGNGVECGSISKTLTIDREALLALTADGRVVFTVQNIEVPPICAVNRHTVRLTYPTAPPRLVFGSLFVGLVKSLPLVLENLGSGDLEVTSLVSDSPQFTVAPSSLLIPPFGTASATVTFEPMATSEVSGTLSVFASDGLTPLSNVALTGMGVAPPVIAVSPDTIEATLPVGGQDLQTLSIYNDGPSTLSFSVAVRGIHRFDAAPPGELSIPGQEASDDQVAVSESGEMPDQVEGAEGAFQLRTFSPGPVTCVVEDQDAGLIYAQVDRGRGFFRYVASANRWEPLTEAALDSGNNCGAALLNGRIYTAYTGNGSSLGVYDIAGGSWSTVPHPLGEPTGNIASDDASLLYLVAGERFVSFNPATREIAQLPSPPFLFHAWGGLRRLGGTLYGHQGNGLRGFASYDIATRAWRLLPPLPDGAVLGAAIDPVRAEYVAYGPHGHRKLYRYSTISGTWSTITLPFGISDGGIGWLPMPLAALYFVQGELGAEFWRLVTGSTLVSLTPGTGMVPPSSFLPIQVQFDSSGVAAGVYEAIIEVSSNDPARPRVSAPATLRVTGEPDIAVWSPVTLSSTQTFSTIGARTTHALPMEVPPAGGGILEVIADGNYRTDIATVKVDGRQLGTLEGHPAGLPCQRVVGTFLLSADDLASVAADGVALVEVQNGAVLPEACPDSHAVNLRYRGPGDEIDFGAAQVGASRSKELLIENRGSDQLDVGMIATDSPAFVSSQASVRVSPHGSVLLDLTFVPTAASAFSGSLSLISNDPDTPLGRVRLQGTGLAPADIRITPSELVSTIGVNSTELQSFTIFNDGAAPLEFFLSVHARFPGATVIPSDGLDVDHTGFSDNSLQQTLAVGEQASHFKGAPGTFTVLSPAPAPLTCVVEDAQAGHLYAQADRGTAFFRYVASSDRWERLAESPIHSGNNGGAALLNGRVYTAYTGNATQLGVYDIANDSWWTIQNPLGEGTGNITSDGKAFLYLAGGPRLVRLDPETGGVVQLSAPPLSFTGWGGLRHWGGKLYGHIGNGSRSFLSYEILTDEWRPLPPLPGGGVLGAAIDPVRLEYLAYGSYRGVNLYRYKIPDGIWAVSTLPFVVDDGGMGWLPGPITGIYFVQGQLQTSFGRLATEPSFLTVTPEAGVVQPHGSADIQVRFDSAGLPPEGAEADINIWSNDPLDPLVTLPVSLEVIGGPDIAVSGAPVIASSTQTYSTSSASTSHRLALTAAPTGEGVLEVIAQGDYGEPFETVEVILEGRALGSLGGSGGGFCLQSSLSIPLSTEDLAALAADGAVLVELQNSPDVHVECVENSHTVRLRYSAPSDRLDFETVGMGSSRTQQLVIENRGTDELEVTSITSTTPDFVPSLLSLGLAPGSAAVLDVTYRPSRFGSAAGSLVIASNSVHNPLVTVALAGVGAEPASVAAEPAALEIALPPGGATSRALRLSNSGGSDLAWTLGIAAEPDSVHLARLGGPDGFGYRSRDSSSPGGPVFDWHDISTDGTALPIAGDDESSGAIPLGFDFAFYGGTFSSVRACTNGFLSFTSTSTAFTNLPLPGASAPRNLLAVFWDDLKVPATGQIRYMRDGSRFVAQYSDVERLDGGGRFTFQVILEASGRIIFQYLRMEGDVGSATIGIQDGTGAVGLLVSHDESHVAEGMSIEIFRPVPWISPRDVSGVVKPGDSIDVILDITSAGLAEGDHSARIELGTNDASRPGITVPANLHVGLVELDGFEVEPEALSLRSRGRTVHVYLELPSVYDPRDIVVSTVSINGTLAPNSRPVAFSDRDDDGVTEIVLAFDRAALQEMLRVGSNKITITGEVRDRIWFVGTTTIRLVGER